MGGDGQALANNRGLLEKFKLYGKPTNDIDGASKQTVKERRIERWSHCALTLEPLEAPIAFDLGGQIYSKQSVIDFLLDRKKNKELATEDKNDANISKLSDVREVTNSFEGTEITCPISGISTLGGLHSFVGLWSCGHIISASLAEDSCEELECPVCETQSIVVPLIVSEELSQQQRRALAEKLRARKKRKRE